MNPSCEKLHNNTLIAHELKLNIFLLLVCVVCDLSREQRRLGTLSSRHTRTQIPHPSNHSHQ